MIHKLARIAKIIVNLYGKYNLNEEDLPASLRDILDSLQRFACLVTIVFPVPHNLTKDQRAG